MGEKYTAIVLSAGSGRRMHSAVPKQYMELGGRPVIYYSLKAFEESKADSVVLVAGAEDIAYCREQIVEYFGFSKVTAVVPGGDERWLSVYQGLLACADSDYVLIHDGARPLLDVEDIHRSMECVRSHKACVLATKVKDTIRIAGEDGCVLDTPNRDTLWAMQTPQSFSYDLLMGAYRALLAELETGGMPVVTDDAGVVERALGQRIYLLPGSSQNIKITTPEDLMLAELLLKSVRH
ncbi:MAG: 2-C-methyl-D-erythritol 4-phosphate cytidylyltransferase [Agathobacter sp.]|nr:2-C-methyl-D-erythritol 4-phosphate cytidylyltransferase [Agathobacter sp.]